MTPDEVKRLLNSRWPPPIAQLCSDIIDFIKKTPDAQLEMITFKTLSNAVGKKTLDKDLFSAATILSTAEISVLDTHVAYIGDDDEFYEITLEELSIARQDGFMIHPDTGERIEKFEDNVVMYFSPSKLMRGDL